MARRTLQVANFPSPIRGMDTVSPLERMGPDTAYQLTNLFPGPSSLAGRLMVQVRGGTLLHCDTGDATPAYTLFTYSGGGTEELLSAHGSGTIYDVTTSTPATLDTGYNSGVWSWSNFANSSGNYILACNDTGLDDAWVYDGATITALVVVGIAANQLARVCVYLQRPFYVERNSLSVWYPAAGTYQGALTELDLSSYATKGGTIANIATWTRDNGAGGMDDLLVVVTTRGQALIYNGIDPSVSTLWVLTGVFDVGAPVAGPNALVRVAADLLLIGSDGIRSMSDYLALGRSQASDTAISRNISSYSMSAVNTSTNTVWTSIVYPEASMLVVGFLNNNDAGYQMTGNTSTGAWSLATGIDAYSWGVFDGGLYCGVPDGKIWAADQYGLGDGDDGTTPISCTWRTSFQDLSSGTGLVRLAGITPNASFPSGSYTLSVYTDYNLFDITANNTGAWTFPPDGQLFRNMNFISAVGTSFMITLAFTATSGGWVQGIRVSYEVGQMI